MAGTTRLVEAAINHGAERFILLSTDKAVDPVSMMGASKRIAELVLLARAAGTLRMKALRLGNVLGSGGSVAPLFLKADSFRRPGDGYPSGSATVFSIDRRCCDAAPSRIFRSQ